MRKTVLIICLGFLSALFIAALFAGCRASSVTDLSSSGLRGALYGHIYAPSGSITQASWSQRWLARARDLLGWNTYAAFSPPAVGSGVSIKLQVLDDDGTATSTVATATTDGNGGYAFADLPNHVLNGSLFVCVYDSGNTLMMRAPASRDSTNVSPATEAVVQILYEYYGLAAYRVGDFSNGELVTLLKKADDAVASVSTSGSLVTVIAACKAAEKADFAFMANLNEFVGSSNPVITNVSPRTGAIGDTVTISGTNLGASFTGSTVVELGGITLTSGNITSYANTSVVLTVPSGAKTGPLSITRGGYASNCVNFVVSGSSYSLPVIYCTDNLLGGAGSTVNIYGINFGSTTVTVNFGTASTTASPTSDTLVTCTVPSGATTGNISITKTVTASALSESTWFARAAGAILPTSWIPDFIKGPPVALADTAVGSNDLLYKSSASLSGNFYTVSGQVQTSDTNAAVPGAKVTACNATVFNDDDSDGSRDGAFENVTYSDASGNYSLKLAPGKYVIEVLPPTSPVGSNYYAFTVEKVNVTTTNVSRNLAVPIGYLVQGTVSPAGVTVINAEEQQKAVSGMQPPDLNLESGLSYGEATTTAGGAYQLVLKKGEYRFEFHPTAAGYPQQYTTYVVTGNATKDWTLNAGSILSGQVTITNTGLPLSSATVKAIKASYNTDMFVARLDSFTTYTDASGNYSLPLFDGTYDVYVNPAPGFPAAIAKQAGVVVSGNTTQNIATPAHVAVTGAVVDGSSNPYAGIGMMIFAASGVDANIGTTKTLKTFAAPDGSFTVYLEQNTQYFWGMGDSFMGGSRVPDQGMPSAGSGGPSSGANGANNGNGTITTTTLDWNMGSIVPSTGVVLDGYVQNASSAPVAYVDIFGGSDSGTPSRAMTTSNASGYYALRILPGNIFLNYFPRPDSGLCQAQQQYALGGSGGTAPLVTLSPAQTITGRVTDGVNGIMGCQVQANCMNDFNSFTMTSTDDNGDFTLQVKQTNAGVSWMVNIFPPPPVVGQTAYCRKGFDNWQSGQADSLLDFTVQSDLDKLNPVALTTGVVIAGTVTDGALPIGGVGLSVFKDAGGGTPDRFYGMARTNPDGTYALGVATNQNYVVMVDSWGYKGEFAPTTCATATVAVSDVSGVNMTMGTASRVKAKLMNGGNAGSNIEVGIYVKSGTVPTNLVRTAYTDQNGIFVTYLTNGTYYFTLLHAWQNAMSPAQIGTVSGADQDLSGTPWAVTTVDKGANAQVQISSAPVTGAMLRLYTDGQSPQSTAGTTRGNFVTLMATQGGGSGSRVPNGYYHVEVVHSPAVGNAGGAANGTTAGITDNGSPGDNGNVIVNSADVNVSFSDGTPQVNY